MSIDFESEKHGELAVKSNGLTRRTFKFDAVFGPQADQGIYMMMQVFWWLSIEVQKVP